MTRDEFRTEVEDFLHIYPDFGLTAKEGWTVEDDDELDEGFWRATVTLTVGEPDNEEFDIVIRQNPDDKDRPAIEAGENSYLPLDGDGLYAWLWVETLMRLRRLKEAKHGT